MNPVLMPPVLEQLEQSENYDDDEQRFRAI